MSSIYKRGGQWWLQFYDAGGQRQRRSTGISVGSTSAESDTSRKEAQEVGRLVELGVQSERSQLQASGKVSLREYARRWISERRRRQLANVNGDEQRLRDHVLPRLGARPLAEVSVPEVRALMSSIMDERRGLAPRTQLAIYATLRTLYADAVSDGLLASSPCVLRARRGELPPREDKDPTWRAGAIFTRDEARRLCVDERILPWRRILYAMAFFSGMRVGELVQRRWRDWDAERGPLGALHIATAYRSATRAEGPTKTRQQRVVPVHRELARVLAAWKLSGWAQKVGRPPTAEDLIVPPASNGGPRRNKQVLDGLHHDLAKLGLRPRRIHDMRRSLISWAREDGASDFLLKSVTHGTPSTSILDVYSTPSWVALCRQVALLDLELRPAAPVVRLVGG